MNWKIDEETKKLIDECLAELHEVVHFDYIINCLIADKYKNMTPKEIFSTELKAKADLEADLEERRQKRV